MEKPSFVHLHTHSEFSILDGASRITDIIDKAVQYGMPAAAITDHGVMYGNISFYSAAKAAGIKPILGCEVYVAPRTRFDRDPKLDREQHHLVLLAKDAAGYKNLIKLVSIAYSEGQYYKPRVDKEILNQYSKGLIAMTACLGGEVPYWIMENNFKQAQQSLSEYTEIFGKDNLYIELQDHNLREQKMVNEALIRLSEASSLKMVCTNDSHYNNQSDSEAHDVLLCIQTQSTLDDPKRMRFGSDQFYLKSPEEMHKLFGHIPGALENTLEIMDRCNIKFDFETSKLPDPGVPKEFTPANYMESEVRTGLAERLGGTIPESYINQLEYECKIINDCGFPLYMLIVRDFTDFAREQGIYIGVRGSAAGSLVCYGLGITDVDPIEYGLTFERFLNPERIELPDIDLDIQDDKRDALIQYVCEKYGSDKVGQIATFGSMKAKAAVRDCGRVLGIELPKVNKICKMIPTIPIGVKIQQVLEENPDLSNAYKQDTEIKRLIDTAQTLEGLSRSVGVHAAGVLISEDPLTDHVPVQTGGKGEFVAQLAKKDIAKIGLLKMDFLGLANLTILADAVADVKRHQNIDIDILNIPLDDQKTFDMLSKGETNGVFQLESAGMRRNVLELKPNSVRELAAIVALYRPGPMQYIPKFVKSKFGKEPIKYLHPVLEPILEETYGVICYQEQVLKIAGAIGGFSMGQADILRKAMSSKDKATMEKQREKFLEGAVANGMVRAIAAKIYEQVEPFAGYAFNKAHAVCYAFVAYRTAYMKANYPVEYYAALLSANMDNKDKLAMYMEDCRRIGLTVLPPNINYSGARFEVENGAIRFGLSAIKGCGKAVIESIVIARESGGKFKDLMDFCERTSERGINKSTTECLIKVGAFSDICSNRAQLSEMLPDATEAANCRRRDAMVGQGGLFEESDAICSFDVSRYSHIGEYPIASILDFEKDLIGLYLSGHPLDDYRELLEKRTTVNASNFSELENNQQCTIGGILQDVELKVTKRGDRMAIAKLEDLYGSINVTFFSREFVNCQKDLIKGHIVLIKGKASHRERISNSDETEDDTFDVEIRGEQVSPIKHANLKQNAIRTLHIRIENEINGKMDVLKNLLASNPGEIPVFLHINHDGKRKKLATLYKVEPDQKLIAQIEGILGKNVIKLM